MEFEFNDDSKYIVIASDGVWEFLDNNRVMALVNPFYNKNDPEGACAVLVKESIDWWEKVNLNISINLLIINLRKIALLMILLVS